MELGQGGPSLDLAQGGPEGSMPDHFVELLGVIQIHKQVGCQAKAGYGPPLLVELRTEASLES